MAYADQQQQMSGNKITALIIVVLIHIALAYALVTGLSYESVRTALKKVTTVDIKEPEKPKVPLPPPPKVINAPPPVAPSVRLDVSVAAPPIVTVQVAPPPPPYVAPAAPPPPPPPRFTPKQPQPKGSPSNWATSNDYPSRALREEREGVTTFRVSVGTDGKVADCQVVNSSGSPDLDQATCDNVRRRARFQPATDGEGSPTAGSYSNRIRWVIPKE